jgi:WhiB family redox-sensing transcriptional regulator
LVLVAVSERARPDERDRGWRSRAACAGADVEEFYPHKAIRQVPPLVERVCVSCPVRGSCLAEALLHHEKGVWGGTTETQRSALRRRYRRDSCPVCGPSIVVPLTAEGREVQVCTSCGLTWLALRARNSAGLVPA